MSKLVKKQMSSSHGVTGLVVASFMVMSLVSPKIFLYHAVDFSRDDTPKPIARKLMERGAAGTASVPPTNRRTGMKLRICILILS